MPIFTPADFENQDQRPGNHAPVPEPAVPTGISLMQSPNAVPGQLPSIGMMCCPGIRCLSCTTVITLLEIMIFITTLVIGATMFDGAFVAGNEMLGPSTETLKYMGGKYTPLIRSGELWRLVTPVFLHAGVIHIACNLFFQMRLGYILELRWGGIAFCVLYLLTGIGGVLLSTAAGDESVVSVGASGALFGMLGADVIYLFYNWAMIPSNKSEACFLIMTLLINILFGMSGTVDKLAHLGGFLSGVFFGMALIKPLVYREKETSYRIFAAALGGALWVLLCVFIWVINAP